MSYPLKTPAIFIALLLEGCAGVQYSLDAGDAVSDIPLAEGALEGKSAAGTPEILMGAVVARPTSQLIL